MPDVTFRATFIDGSTVRSSGWIDVTSDWESQDLSMTISAVPRNNVWTVLAGSMPDTSGTLKGFSVNGVPYRVAGDGNVKIAADYKNEAKATSGVNIRQMTKQPRTMSEIKLTVNLQEYETLRQFITTP